MGLAIGGFFAVELSDCEVNIDLYDLQSQVIGRDLQGLAVAARISRYPPSAGTGKEHSN